MIKKKILPLLSIALLASCVQEPTTQAPQQQKVALFTMHLYRGLRLIAGSANQIDWSRASFGVSGQPVPTLSLFDNVAVAPTIPCWLEISVDVPGNAPPAPNVTGQLTIPNPPPGAANAGPWPVDFDNVPPGHWSITGATIGGNSNTQASTRAAAVFDAMAHAPAPTATVIDGAVNGCH